MKYYSQFSQDRFIDIVVFNRKRGGFFVDIGAHNGISLSNTYFFEQFRDYAGLCIEPNPKVFDQLKNNRKCEVLNSCIADTKGTVKFMAIEGYSEMLSGIVDHYHPKHLERIDNYISERGGAKHEIYVACTQLQEIPYLKNKQVDFVSLDTEGNELSILKSINFSEINVKCFTIENSYGNINIEILMKQNGFIKVKRLGDDDIYIVKSRYDLAFKIRRTLDYYRQKVINLSSRFKRK